MADIARIGIIGDFNPTNPTHIATNGAIQDASNALGRHFESIWLPTDETHDFRQFHGLFGSPGSPYKSLDGALDAIRSARQEGIPFLGTCGGFQHLVLEYARNVMGIAEASHAETDPCASCLFITPLICSLVGKAMQVHLKHGSEAARLYGTSSANESYYCNFGLNPVYRRELEEAGLEITGTDQDGDVRIVELLSHPFFCGTLFVPQVKSKPGRPHPLVLGFCRAAIGLPSNAVLASTDVAGVRAR